MSPIAGQVSVFDVMVELARARPVFHSEADLQFAFAQTLQRLAPEMEVRLEVPLRGVDGRKGSQYLDLWASGPAGRTAVELKYFTRAWVGTDSAGEEFALRHHAATDLARRNFVFDVSRLEQFCGSGLAQNGIAIILTNDSNLWTRSRRLNSNDRAFHIHDGGTLTGVLRWGKGMYPGNTRELAGTYELQWHDFSHLDGSQFRWLAIVVDGGSASSFTT